MVKYTPQPKQFFAVCKQVECTYTRYCGQFYYICICWQNYIKLIKVS